MAKKAIKKKSTTKVPKPKKVIKAKPKKAATTLVWKRSKAGRPKRPSLGARRSRQTTGGQAPAAKQKKPATHKKNVAEGFTTPLTLPSPLGGEGVSTEPNGGEMFVGESKFQLGPKENAGDFQAHNIPFDYGLNRIILLVVDPKFAFVYWEVQTDKMHEAISAIGNDAKLTLRFHEVNSSSFWDVSIYERVSNWYLKLAHPERRLWVEIGMKNDRGYFFPIAQSSTMQMPRAGLARPGPIKWMLVSPSGEKVITEIEEYTDADLELLKKILGPYFFDLFRRGRFATITGSSAENIFMSVEEIQPPSLSS